MAQTKSQTESSTSIPDEQSWLLPANRKLRNLISVSLRSLSLAPVSPARKRGQTIDDDALPQTLASPAKIVASRNQRALGQSRSSSDLRALAENVLDVSDAEMNTSDRVIGEKRAQRLPQTSPSTTRRPDFLRSRRRSTIEWVNATSQKRQEKLERIAAEKMADAFFSLHVQGVEEPVYISEIVKRSMNPSFRQIDWTVVGPGVTRLEQLSMHIWVKRNDLEDWRELFALNVDLKALHYLGKSLDRLEYFLPKNAVVFHLTDGIYTPFPETLINYKPPQTARPRNPLSSFAQRPLPTSSFDALLRLSKLDDSIQDALATRDQLVIELEYLLKVNEGGLKNRDHIAEAEDRLKTIEFAKRTVNKQLEKAQQQLNEKRASITARRKIMATDHKSRKTQSQSMIQVQAQLPDMRREHAHKAKDMQSQRRRICEDLQQVYPIEPLPGKPLAFNIRHLHVPNSESLDTDSPELVSAAFGYVAHALQLLAFYLQQALPYPVTPRGSTSTIYDPISMLKTNTFLSSDKVEHTLRTYPLFIKGVPRFRFEYAVFLINQDIRVLLENAFHLRVLDIRQTLPNLKYLIYVATAGEGELPARKAGGVRGLVRAPMMERVASNDSTTSAMSGLTLAENGRPKSVTDRLKEIGGKGKATTKA